jgi:hypothetical protein
MKKMPINSRAKGKTAERELINELSPLLPFLKLERNLDQTREGGYDIKGMGQWAAEVKRYKVIKPGDFKRFWTQTLEQARSDRKLPALFMREDNREWVVVVRLHDVMVDCEMECDDWLTCQVSLAGFVHVYKANNWEI